MNALANLVADADAELHGLAARLADGEDLPKDQIAAALRAANWSPHDLTRTVGIVKAEREVEQVKERLAASRQVKVRLMSEREQALADLKQIDEEIERTYAKRRRMLVERAEAIPYEMADSNLQSSNLQQELRGKEETLRRLQSEGGNADGNS